MTSTSGPVDPRFEAQHPRDGSGRFVTKPAAVADPSRLADLADLGAPHGVAAEDGEPQPGEWAAAWWNEPDVFVWDAMEDLARGRAASERRLMLHAAAAAAAGIAAGPNSEPDRAAAAAGVVVGLELAAKVLMTPTAADGDGWRDAETAMNYDGTNNPAAVAGQAQSRLTALESTLARKRSNAQARDRYLDTVKATTFAGSGYELGVWAGVLAGGIVLGGHLPPREPSGEIEAILGWVDRSTGGA